MDPAYHDKIGLIILDMLIAASSVRGVDMPDANYPHQWQVDEGTPPWRR